MFSADIRVNGSMVVHVYGRNLGVNDDGTCRYVCDIYEPEKGVKTFTLNHARQDGLKKLIADILLQADQDVGFLEGASNGTSN